MLEIVVCCRDACIRKWLGDVIEEYATLHHAFINVNMFADHRNLSSQMDNGCRFQIVILDMSMNTESTGPPDLELVVNIRKRDRSCIIIFIAESADYALWGYSVHAFDYWVKPLDKRRVARTIGEAAGILQENSHEMLPIRGRGFNTPVRHSGVIYIESVKHHLKIHMTNGSIYEVYGKLDDYEQRLKASALFLRCHQSFLVNMDRVESISGRDFIMDDGSRIPIRKSSAAKLKKEYYKYVTETRFQGTGGHMIRGREP
jgi:two-component system LytT family response regulator